MVCYIFYNSKTAKIDSNSQISVIQVIQLLIIIIKMNSCFLMNFSSKMSKYHKSVCSAHFQICMLLSKKITNCFSGTF